MFVLNAAEAVGGGDRFIARRLAESGLPTIVVVNQADRVAPAAIAATIAHGAGLVDFVAVHPVSALTGDGLEALAADLAGLLPEGPRYFPEGVSTDQTDEELAGELIREAALARVRQEVPHAVAVQVEGIDAAHDGGRTITATILVERDSQKAMLVGRGGATIREVGTGAREVLARLWGVPVHLALTVKVRRRWRQDDRMLDRLGL
jgi:GTP-binding protein Era